MKSPSEVCENCGALMREYWFPLSSGIVQALIKFGRAVKFYGRNDIHIHDEMKASNNYEIRLTDHEWNNFTHLRFHALVAKFDNNKSGHWLLTERGLKFLRGEIAVPKKVKTYRNQVIDHSEELIHISDFKNIPIRFEREFDYDIREGIVVRYIEGQTTLL